MIMKKRGFYILRCEWKWESSDH